MEIYQIYFPRAICGNCKKSEYQLMLYDGWDSYAIFLYLLVTQQTSVNVLCTPMYMYYINNIIQNMNPFLISPFDIMKMQMYKIKKLRPKRREKLFSPNKSMQIHYPRHTGIYPHPDVTCKKCNKVSQSFRLVYVLLLLILYC